MSTMINKTLNVAVGETFGKVFPMINECIFENKEIIKSRNGDTKELLNFKTIVKNPYARCTGGYERDMNVFFLLAESLWIWSGRADVAWLDIFNSRMKDYSDNQKVFHAPYGYRMRNWGSHSNPEIGNYRKGYKTIDQLAEVIHLLIRDKETRQAVISIWNPDLDNPSAITKDRPCNSMLMFKIRNNKLFTTIQNRSNDIQWGLPTNVFQFSFISEIIASILGIELDEQVHNSQSLHMYLDKPEGEKVYRNYVKSRRENEKSDRHIKSELYEFCIPSRMDFNFNNDNTQSKIRTVDLTINNIIENLEDYFNNKKTEEEIQTKIECTYDFSLYFAEIFKILFIYIKYKKSNKEDSDRIEAYKSLVESHGALCDDYYIMCKNFFYNRIRVKMNIPSILKIENYIGKL